MAMGVADFYCNKIKQKVKVGTAMSAFVGISTFTGSFLFRWWK
jgi:hypothetical protein